MTEPLWDKAAVIYQLLVKSCCDSSGGGIGDFRGLTSRLDCIALLSINTIRRLPFYPPPRRDDGYEIADHRAIHPDYGMMRGFRRFVAEAHRRGLRGVTELVVNNTSDKHPWFQRARQAPKGYWRRDFYVWADDDNGLPETRIIFLDTETSNWPWDDAAKAYHRHRFYNHQPDPNCDNPRVLRKIISVPHFRARMGVDGIPLDAEPYLIERPATINENLPETHAILRRIRAEVDAHYSGRMLRAEASRWPEDVKEHFGAGDDCHLCLHFPLMPRMCMGVAQEDRHPITDILRQTPNVPEGCPWAIFLRNHDELTLEMVTDDERKYLWNTFAADRRARLDLGIRRRLAPPMEHDRRRIELMNCLPLPGTPVIYCVDELGMGDNIFPGDRNGGFSRAEAARPVLPANTAPLTGFATVDVEAQEQNRHSLLNRTRRMVTIRQARATFGRRSLRLLYPGNRKILAFLREHGEETTLCVAKLSRSAQAVELDRSALRGRVPVELAARTPFPPAWLPLHRWTAEAPPTRVTLAAATPLPTTDGPMLPAEIETSRDRKQARYFVPLALATDGGNALTLRPALARVRRGRAIGHLTDGFARDALARALMATLRDARQLPDSMGEGIFRRTAGLGDMALPDSAEDARRGTEQANTSFLVDGQIVLKLVRRIEDGIHPEAEIARLLTDRGFNGIPPFLGAVVRVTDHGERCLMIARGFVRNQVDGRRWLQDQRACALDDTLAAAQGAATEAAPFANARGFIAACGARIAQMHAALAQPGGAPDTDPRAADDATRAAWQAAASETPTAALDRLAARLPDQPSDLAPLAEAAPAARTSLEALPRGAERTIRIYGDLTLGRILAASGEPVIIGCEGDPARTIAERRAHAHPARDIATMLVSLSDAALADPVLPPAAAAGPQEAAIRRWHEEACSAFLAAYFAESATGLWPDDAAARERPIALFVLDAASRQRLSVLDARPARLLAPLRELLLLARG